MNLLFLLAVAFFLGAPLATSAQRLSSSTLRARDGPPQPLRALLQRLHRRPKHFVALGALAAAADLELFAACSAAGLNPALASAAVASVSAPQSAGYWQQVANLLALGVPAQRAWEIMRKTHELKELAALAVTAEQSGSAVIENCLRLARQLRAEAKEEATTKAEKAGVLIALPLTLCFLPAFLVLGLAPVVISLGSQMLQH